MSTDKSVDRYEHILILNALGFMALLIHFQQDTGLRFSCNIYSQAIVGKEDQRYHYLYHHNFLPSPHTTCPTLTEQVVGGEEFFIG